MSAPARALPLLRGPGVYRRMLRDHLLPSVVPERGERVSLRWRGVAAGTILVAVGHVLALYGSQLFSVALSPVVLLDASEFDFVIGLAMVAVGGLAMVAAAPVARRVSRRK